MRNSFFVFVCVVVVVSNSAIAQNMEVNNLPEWAIGGFVRPTGLNPIISPDTTKKFNCPMRQKSIDWESNDTFNPAAAVKDNTVVVMYRAEDKSGTGIGGRTSRIGYAESADGLLFKRFPTPVVFPANDSQKEMEWTGGCEDPRVAVTDNGIYVMMYTQWNQKVPRLAVATSKDLKAWEKHGPAFKTAYDSKFYNIASKSASILTEVKNNKQVIIKINGKYWIYWGEENVYAAISDDLKNWSPLVDDKGNLKKLMSPREGYFDSQLTECGPPAVLTNKGIVLMYNGKNSTGDKSDKRFNENTYCAGEALFDKNDPSKLIDRLAVPFLRPLEAFEKSGQYPAGTVFIEGLVYFKMKWYLYYGCADSRVSVAVCDPANPANGDTKPAKQ